MLSYTILTIIAVNMLTLSVLSLLRSIVYVAGKGLMGYIHDIRVQTMLTSPAIPPILPIS